MEIIVRNDLINEDYHNSPEYKSYWSSSNLKEYNKTPREAYYQKFEAEKKESPAMDFGTAVHDFLESKHYKGAPFDYNVFEPPTNPSTGKFYGETSDKYKNAKALIENPISSDNLYEIKKMWQVIKESEHSPVFEKILNEGSAEESLFIENESGFKYKIRKDITTDNGIYDYKTLKKSDFTKNGLNKVVINCGYGFSAAMYQYIEFLATGKWKTFNIIWISKEAPYDVHISDMSEYGYNVINGELIESNIDARKFESAMFLHEKCMTDNYWPGLSSMITNNKLIPPFYYQNSI